MRVFAISLLALSTLGCDLTGPSASLAGLWRANVGDRFSFVYLNLEQDGDAITGTACSAGATLKYFAGVPVHGDFPDLQFTVTGSQAEPCCAAFVGSVFRGRQDSSKDIVGTYRGSDIRFTRFSANPCG
jgi:hypothetical protein